MNEQIRKLYEQANIRHTNDYALSGKPREEWRSIPDLFAELIVKECAKFLAENSGYDNSNNAWHPEPEDLLKHFGVEE